MASIDNFVTVTITKDTATLTRVGFGLPAMLTYNTAQIPLAALYGSVDEMTTPTGPFATNSREIAIATAIFSQNPKPTGVIVLRRASAPLRTVTVTPVTDATAGKPFATQAYSITLGDGTSAPETFTFTTDATPTVAEITLGLVTAINLGGVDVLATDGTTDFQIESAASPGGAATAGVPFTMAVDRTLMTQEDDTADPGLAADLAAARLVNDDWYLLLSDATSKLEITVIGAAIGALFRGYIAESADDDILTVVTTDIASTQQTLAAERTWVMSHPLPHGSPGGAWAGKQLPNDPGSSTWAFKTLTGIAAQAYTAAEIAFLDSKNCNYYTTVAGVNTTVNGKAASGEFIDIVRGIDWLRQRMKENVFRPFVTTPKISFEDEGIQTIVNEVEGTLRLGKSRKLIAKSPAFVVTAPRASAVSSANKAARLLPDVTFTAPLSGAIHKTTIVGRVTV